MEVMPIPRQTFMPELKRHEPAVRDSTIVMKQKTCRRLYFFTVVCGFQERGNSRNLPLIFGSAYHKFREVLESTDGDIKAALTACMSYWMKHATEPIIGTKWDFLTGQRLLASCEAAYKYWRGEKQAKKIEVVKGLVEGPAMITLSDGVTKIGARFDQVTRWAGRLYPRDFKSTSKQRKWFERNLEPNDQFSRQLLITWRLSGELPQGLFVEMMFNDKKNGPEVIPLTTARTEEQLVAFEKNEIYLSNELAACREADFWPMEEKQCPFCPFRLVCRATSERAAVAQLKAGFEQRVWDFTAADLNAEPEE